MSGGASRQRPDAASRLRAASAGLLCALAAALAACSTVSDAVIGPREGLEARLRPIGASTVTGTVLFSERSDGVSMLATLNSLPRGDYRIVIHATGNCSSPNGFSAGPPWTPPGGTGAAIVSVAATANPELSSTGVSEKLKGLHLDGPGGIAGRSVVIHSGSGTLEARPDVPNNRVACGVIGPRTPMI